MKIMKTIKKISLSTTLAFILEFVPNIVEGQNTWYISADVNQSGYVGDGSLNNPWNLRKGLEQKQIIINQSGIKIVPLPNFIRVQPGDTVYLRGGTYWIKDMIRPKYINNIKVSGEYDSNGVTTITSVLTGKEDNPIHVRNYPGEHAVIDMNPGTNVPAISPVWTDNKLLIQGQYTNYYDFEITNSGSGRFTERAGVSWSDPADLYRGSISVGGGNGPSGSGIGVKIINFIIHDIANGIFSSTTAINSEIYGCIIYNNGYDAPDGKGHGHGIYGQNNTDIKLVSDNIVFNQFSLGFQMYSSGSGGGNAGFDFYRNISFGNGSSSIYNKNGGDSGYLAEGENVTVSENHIYFGGGQFGGVIFTDNYIANGGVTINTYSGSIAKIKDNTFIAPGGKQLITWRNIGNSKLHTVNDNKYFYNITAGWHNRHPFRINDEYMGFNDFQDVPGWRTRNSNFDTKSDFNKAGVMIPTKSEIFVYPNKYETGRANIVVYRWSKNMATFSLSSSKIAEIGINIGDLYAIYNAQNFFGTPVVATTTYNGGSINVPILTNSNAVLPLDGNGGYYKPNMPNLAPLFNVYVIRKIAP